MATYPAGVLLYGPPGTGKTLMAEAVAGETGKPYVFVEPGVFLNMFFGVGVLKVRSLFKKLQEVRVAIWRRHRLLRRSRHAGQPWRRAGRYHAHPRRRTQLATGRLPLEGTKCVDDVRRRASEP